RIIRRHKWKILIITSAVTLFTLISSILTKPQPLYQATASIAIDKKESESSVFGGFSRKDYNILESETELIKSFPVVFTTAKKIGIIPANISYDGFQNNQDVLARVLAFQNKIKVAQQGDTNIIDITAENPDPEIARNSANTIAEIYKQQNQEKNLKQSRSAREFVERRLNIGQQDLKKVENEVKRFEETYDVIAMGAQSNILLRDEDAFNKALSRNKNKMEEMELMSNRFKKDQENYDDILIDIRPGVFSGQFQHLVTQLVDQISKKKFLLTVYTNKNPEVTAVQNEINISIDNINGQLKSSIEILKSEREDLNAKLDKIKAELGKVPESSLKYGRLKRKVIAKNEIVALLDEKYQEALIREADQVEEIRVVRPALLPQSPINPPKVKLKTILGFAIGLIISMGFSFIFENFDTSFDTIDDLESIVKLPVVGVVPFINLKELLAASGHGDIPLNLTSENPLSALVMHYFPKKPVAESFRSLRTNVVFETSRDKSKVICVTSSLPQEGKSTVSANLALSFAQAGKHVLLVDMDLRKGTLHQMFGVVKAPGFVDMVLESTEPSYTMRDITDIIMGEIGMDLIARTPGWDNFDLIPIGSATRGNETEILNSAKLKDLIKKWKEEYDYVVIDVPPVLVASDAQIISPLVEKMLLVYKVGEVARGSLLRAKTQVDSVKANVMGIVINGLKQEMSADFGQYQYYSDYYKDEKEKPERTFSS
ncbi:MAG: polysaccharide biosynthesis tyrosine autokinase, partial [Nitrospinota bacterium]